MLLPAKLSQCPVTQLEIPATLIGGSSGIVERMSYHLPCHQGASPGQLGGDPLGANGQLDPEKGLILQVSQGEGLGCTMELGEMQESARGGITAH
jgi:hypothetical protein